jgi:hypothetical protein
MGRISMHSVRLFDCLRSPPGACAKPAGEKIFDIQLIDFEWLF